MKPVVIVPPWPSPMLAEAVMVARAIDPAPAGLVLAGRAIKELEAPEGLVDLRCIDLPGPELPDFHALGLLLASAVDSLRADVVVAPLCAGRPMFEPVPAAIAAQLDWPIVNGVHGVTRQGDELVVEVRRGAGRHRRLPAPVILVASASRVAPVASASANTRTVLSPAQLQVPATRLRPCSEAIGELVMGASRGRTAVVGSARALVSRLLDHR